MRKRPYDWNGLHGNLPKNGGYFFNRRETHRKALQKRLERETADARKIGKRLSTLIHELYRTFVENESQAGYASELGLNEESIFNLESLIKRPGMAVVHKTVRRWREGIAKEENQNEKKHLAEGLEQYIRALSDEEETASFALVMTIVLRETKEFDEFFEKCGENPIFFYRHRKKDKPVPVSRMVECMKKWRGISGETCLSDAIEQSSHIRHAVEAAISDMCVREGVSEPLACLMCMYELSGHGFTRESLESHGVAPEHCSALLEEDGGNVAKDKIEPAIKWIELQYGEKIADVIRETWEENSAQRELRDARNKYFADLIAGKNRGGSARQHPRTCCGIRHSTDEDGRCEAGKLKKPPPTDACPGSAEKVDVLAGRYANGYHLWNEDDNPSHEE